MNQFQLNIKQVYLDSIKKGDKTHEYRLATAKRRKVQIGDELILVSNTNPNYKLAVKVNEIEIFPNWHDALINYWEQDFKGVYSSLQETINACKQFYSEQEVLDNQIIVYHIKEK